MHPPWPTIGDMDVDDEPPWMGSRRVGQGDCTLPPPANQSETTPCLAKGQGQRDRSQRAGLTHMVMVAVKTFSPAGSKTSTFTGKS